MDSRASSTPDIFMLSPSLAALQLKYGGNTEGEGQQGGGGTGGVQNTSVEPSPLCSMGEASESKGSPVMGLAADREYLLGLCVCVCLSSAKVSCLPLQGACAGRRVQLC
jgi:hypothetical protein